ncbi:MAG: MBL fold metallo-hydrolase [Planctomycetes bacterium]|nr:MBL fold metallo-hydrolase [Planctomycetota bacterium]
MSELRVDVLALGTLAKNRFWDETRDMRDEVATCSLVRSGKTVLVVDPGWPDAVLQAVLFYRAGLRPEDVTDVFLTHLDPAHAGGTETFQKARWLAYEEEVVYGKAELKGDRAIAAILGRLKPAPEHIVPGVDIFPTPGHSPGHCSLMVNSPTETTFIAGDAVLTRDHLEHGDLGPTVWDRDKAAESFAEVLEIGDFVIPGHDNIVWLRSQGNLL